jgi:hypothetical protein
MVYGVVMSPRALEDTPGSFLLDEMKEAIIAEVEKTLQVTITPQPVPPPGAAHLIYGCWT